MTRLVTKADLARRAGVSKPAISKACKTGALRVACDGDRIDLDHPAVRRAYPAAFETEQTKQPESGEIAAGTDAAAARAPKAPRRRDVAPTTPAAGEAGKARKPDPTPTAEEVEDDGVDEELAGEFRSLGPDASKEEIQRLTRVLRPIVVRHGAKRPFKDWLDALSKLEEIRKRRLDNEETEGRLISRELVKSHVFGAIEGSHLKLLTDAPKTIIRIVYAMAESKEPPEAAEARVRELISKILKPVKATAERVVENA